MNRYQIAFILSDQHGDKTGIYTGSANSLNEFFCNFGAHILKLKAIGCSFENKDVKIIERDGQRVSIQAKSADIKDSKFFVDMALQIGKIQDITHDIEVAHSLMTALQELSCRERSIQDRRRMNKTIKAAVEHALWVRKMSAIIDQFEDQEDVDRVGKLIEKLAQQEKEKKARRSEWVDVMSAKIERIRTPIVRQLARKALMLLKYD